MTMASLVDRLRTHADDTDDPVVARLCREAADRIDAMHRTIRRVASGTWLDDLGGHRDP